MKSFPEYIVTDPAGVQACCEDIAASSQVGFDTEFVGEDTYVPHLCLVQVATPNALYVLDPFDCGPLEEFWTLLADPARLVELPRHAAHRHGHEIHVLPHHLEAVEERAHAPPLLLRQRLAPVVIAAAVGDL